MFEKLNRVEVSNFLETDYDGNKLNFFGERGYISEVFIISNNERKYKIVFDNEKFNKFNYLFSDFELKRIANTVIDYTDVSVTFGLRGDDLSILKKLVNRMDSENEDELSWLIYLRNTIEEHLINKEDNK